MKITAKKRYHLNKQILHFFNYLSDATSIALKSRSGTPGLKLTMIYVGQSEEIMCLMACGAMRHDESLKRRWESVFRDGGFFGIPIARFNASVGVVCRFEYQEGE